MYFKEFLQMLANIPKSHPNTTFIAFPAIDLRGGKVVRLKEGDPLKQTAYSDKPIDMAYRWLDAGAKWLHVINLDGAFGDDSMSNWKALRDLAGVAKTYGAYVQFGGGLRSLETVEMVMGYGINRVILGTAVLEKPELVSQVLAAYGSDALAISLDSRDGIVQTRGWQQNANISAIDLGKKLKKLGVSKLIYTDISRDGMQTGINLPATVELALSTNLQVIASGGVRSMEDVNGARDAGLAGIIIGRALYEGSIQADLLFSSKKD
jgi:phosphoribosylformimino-5-aminoimidazole carboxamide ribotide isomerase